MTRARSWLGHGAGGVVSLLVLCVGLAGCSPAPNQETFYTAPVPPGGRPGDVVRSRSSKLSDLGATVTTVQSWQVVYRSTSADDRPIAVSGTVLVPRAPWAGPGKRPLVSYGVGTRGVGDPCAPSRTLSNGTDYEIGFIKALVAKGYAVAVTDYEGLGPPGLHTYMVGRSQGHAALDMARAAQRLPGTGLDASTPIGVWGYSQGGATAAWAAELAPTYAPELQIKGVVMGGVPADLMEVSKGLDGRNWVAFGLLAAIGFDAAYPDLGLETYLNDRGRQLITQSQQLCLVSLGGIGTFLGVAYTRLNDYVTTDPRETAIWQRRLGENRLGANVPKMPVLQYHGEQDMLVAFPQAQALRSTYCQKGATLTWKTFPNVNHVSGIAVGQDVAVTFLADRFAGVPATSNCGA